MSPDEFHQISHITITKEAWQILEITYEGTKKVKDTKLKMLTTQFEELRMSEDFNWIWGAEGINVYITRPSTRGTQAMGVHLGSFLAQVGGVMSNIACLKIPILIYLLCLL